MKSEQCLALWQKNESDFECETLLTRDLGDLVRLRWELKQETSVYYISSTTLASDIPDRRAAAVWQDDDGEWQYWYDNPKS